QPVVTRTSNLVPIALLDVAVVIVVSALIFLAWRDVARRGWRLGSRRVAWRLAIWVASTYLAFLIAWGFNYRRLPLVDRLAFDREAVTAAAATELANRSADELNRLHAAAHAANGSTLVIDSQLSDAFAAVTRDLGAPRRVVVGRPKWSVFNWYF